VIYVDTSVALAQLLSEDTRPPPRMWSEQLVSSRLTSYETWNRINTSGCTGSHGQATRELLGRISFLELSPVVLARALEPFPVRLRTLDALHLASVGYLRERRIPLELATYDQRMVEAAEALDIPLYDLGTP
jgi:hypothetical protein